MQAVILAAGASSRFFPFGDTSHKSMISLCGKPILAWTLDSLHRAKVSEAVVITNPKDESMHQLLKGYKDLRIRRVVQEKPLGMGDALLSAKKYLAEEFLVLHAYHFDAPDFIPQMLAKKDAAGVILAVETAEPWKYGILTLSGSRAVGVVEKPPKGKESSKMKVSGIYLLKKEYLDVLEKTRLHQYQFEEALNSYMEKNRVVVVKGESKITFKYPWDLFLLRDWLLEKLPAKRAKSAKIAKTATISGKVIIEEGAQIYDYALVQGPVYVGRDTVVGAYSVLREHAVLEEKAEIQRHVDCPRSIIGPDSHVHTGFVGDSILGTGIRIGAGLMTANRRIDRGDINVEVKGEKVASGRSYLGALVGDEVKMGVNVTLMPGVAIGAGCMIGPNTVVMENLSPKTLFYTDYKKAAVTKKLG